MKFIYIMFFTIFLVACEDDVRCELEPNQELRTKIFEKCMDSLVRIRSSNGGNYTTYQDEDIDEAIDSCEDSAYRQSLRKICYKRQ